MGKPCKHPCCPDNGPCRKPKKTKEMKPIKKFSDKRKKQNTIYLQKRNAYLKLFPICQCCKLKKATELHHKRGRLNDLLTDERYFFAICRDCHRWAEEHPEWAKANGFSESRLSNPYLISSTYPESLED